MSTTIRINLTGSGRNAHADLDEIARQLHALAARFQVKHERYAARRVKEVIYDAATDAPAGAWEALSHPHGATTDMAGSRLADAGADANLAACCAADRRSLSSYSRPVRCHTMMPTRIPAIMGTRGGAAMNNSRLLTAAPLHADDEVLRTNRFSFSGKVSAYMASATFAAVSANSGTEAAIGFASMAPADNTNLVDTPSATAAATA
jgi:hypothetical protein